LKERKRKIEEKMSNDPHYNLLFKLSHKIATKEGQAEIKKIIPAKSAKILEEALKNKSNFILNYV
jgi:hypothetical protein